MKYGSSDRDLLYREREISMEYASRNQRAITYLSQQIDGDNNTLDQTLSEAIAILEGKI